MLSTKEPDFLKKNEICYSLTSINLLNKELFANQNLNQHPSILCDKNGTSAIINFKETNGKYKTSINSNNYSFGIIYDLEKLDILSMYNEDKKHNYYDYNQTNNYQPKQDINNNLYQPNKTKQENLIVLKKNTKYNEVLIKPTTKLKSEDNKKLPIKSLMFIVPDGYKDIYELPQGNADIDNIINFQRSKQLNFIPVFDQRTKTITRCNLSMLKKMFEHKKDIVEKCKKALTGHPKTIYDITSNILNKGKSIKALKSINKKFSNQNIYINTATKKTNAIQAYITLEYDIIYQRNIERTSKNNCSFKESKCIKQNITKQKSNHAFKNSVVIKGKSKPTKNIYNGRDIVGNSGILNSKNRQII